MKEVFLPNGKRLVFSHGGNFVFCDVHPPPVYRPGRIIYLPAKFKVRLIHKPRTIAQDIFFNCRPYMDRKT